MRSGGPVVYAVACVVALSLARAHAAPPAEHADPASDRLTFLTLRLSSAEESLKAINGALKISGYKVRVADDKAAGYQKGNELMDRKGGGPVPWDQFYGKTAKSFATEWNDPIRRPKQFDYLYHANDEQAAKAKEEVAAIGRKVDALLARRRQLELERITLWASISMESVTNRELSFKPLYRLQLIADKPGAATQPALDPRIATLDGVVVFLRTIDASAKAAEDSITTDPGKALTGLKQAAAAAHAALQEAIFKASQGAPLGAAEAQQVKDMAALAKKIQSLSQNIVEAFDLSRQSEAAGDDTRKQTFDGALQESLLGFADAAGELDDLIPKAALAWGVHGQAGLERKNPAPAVVAAGNPPAAGRNPAGPATVQAEMIGHNTGVPFVEEAPAGTILVGFEFTARKVKRNEIVKSVRAIYRGPAGDVLGKQLGEPSGAVTRIVARPGYGVSAIEGGCGANYILRLTVRFVRVNGNVFVPSDTYDSPTFGQAGNGSTTVAATKPVIGIHGGSGSNIDSIGLTAAP